MLNIGGREGGGEVTRHCSIDMKVTNCIGNGVGRQKLFIYIVMSESMGIERNSNDIPLELTVALLLITLHEIQTQSSQ